VAVKSIQMASSQVKIIIWNIVKRSNFKMQGKETAYLAKKQLSKDTTSRPYIN
jgi:hypothetical protein